MSGLREQTLETVDFLLDISTTLLRVLVARLIGLSLSVVGSIIITMILFELADPEPLRQYLGFKTSAKPAFMTVGTLVIWIWKIDDPAGILTDN